MERSPVNVAWPTGLDEAVEAAAAPEAQLLSGGTDFVVEVNAGQRRPSAVVALRRVRELRHLEVGDDEVVIGAGTTFTKLSDELASAVPALAAAARTVGSPQIRNAGTIGGNIATASPAGDTLPVLAALDATVELRSAGGTRSIPVRDVITGVKRTTLAPGELLVSVRVPRMRGPQHFLKVGTRNAMVIALASVALVVDEEHRTVAFGLGSVGPVVVRPQAAETFMAAAVDWETMTVAEGALVRCGQLAAQAAVPISDHRATAEYRRHAISVIVGRALRRSVRVVSG
jgi:CO/xanthine dehydrogenase FAD-binding subunit